MSVPRPRTTLSKLLRGYYYWARPALAVAYIALLLGGRRVAHPLDLLLLLMLWCVPLWVRKRLLPAAERRDPGFAVRLREALVDVDAERAGSVLPWVRARP